MAVSLSPASTTPPSSAVPAAPLPPPRSSSLSPGAAPPPQVPGRSRSSRKGAHSHREVRFGNYILGQTLGEGEFGKVKLGWKRPEQGQTSGDGVQVISCCIFDCIVSLMLITGCHQIDPQRERRHQDANEQDRSRNRNLAPSPSSEHCQTLRCSLHRQTYWNYP
jgi:hypothetical protein